MNKQKQQSPIAEKWNEIIKRWKDIPPIDNSIAPWPLSRGFNQDNQSELKHNKRMEKEDNHEEEIRKIGEDLVNGNYEHWYEK